MQNYSKAQGVTMALLLATQICSASMAQTTVLTGRVSDSTSRVRLIEQPARYDTRVRLPAQATRTVVIQRPVTRTVYVKDNRTFFQRHPRVKAAAIGAGVGTAAGAVTGLIARRGVVRGAAIGAGTGAGVGLLRSSPLMKRHPIVNDVATGSLVGLGVSAAATRGGKRLWQGTGVGAAVGLGAGLLRNGLR